MFFIEPFGTPASENLCKTAFVLQLNAQTSLLFVLRQLETQKKSTIIKLESFSLFFWTFSNHHQYHWLLFSVKHFEMWYVIIVENSFEQLATQVSLQFARLFTIFIFIQENSL